MTASRPSWETSRGSHFLWGKNQTPWSSMTWCMACFSFRPHLIRNCPATHRMKLSLPRQACSNLHVLIRATALVSPFSSLLLSKIYLLRGSSHTTSLLYPSWLSWEDFFFFPLHLLLQQLSWISTMALVMLHWISFSLYIDFRLRGGAQWGQRPRLVSSCVSVTHSRAWHRWDAHPSRWGINEGELCLFSCLFTQQMVIVCLFWHRRTAMGKKEAAYSLRRWTAIQLTHTSVSRYRVSLLHETLVHVLPWLCSWGSTCWCGVTTLRHHRDSSYPGESSEPIKPDCEPQTFVTINHRDLRLFVTGASPSLS